VSEANVTAWSRIVPEEVLPGIFRQTVDGVHQTLVRYVYGPGSVFPVHSHPQEQITTVLSGRIVFTVGGSRFELGPGDVAVIPGHVAHGATVDGKETVVTLNTLSPRREHPPTV
jgi:quercetin dioxygenase-like cupin family protein